MRPPGFVQVDVDGLWAVRACYGKAEEETFLADPCWLEGVPRLARTFMQADVPASFFLVGRDLDHPDKFSQSQRLLREGFELGNHSQSHILGLTLRPSGEILHEIQEADARLRALGARPVGFRAPGYDVDVRVLRAVRQCGYLYDASVLPTFLSPLLRLADAWLARRWDPKKRQFGRLSYARAPRAPWFPLRYKLRKQDPAGQQAAGPLLEIPVGVTPWLRLPLTGAALLGAPRWRLRHLFQRLAESGRPTLLLLHAIDGTDCRSPIIFDNRRPALGGFALSGEEKARSLRRIVEEFARVFAVQRADDFARAELRRA